MTHAPHRPHLTGFYPISTFYVSSVAVLILTDLEFFNLPEGVIVLAVSAVLSVQVAHWRDLKSVHALVNGQRSEMRTELADLKQIMRRAGIQVPPSAAEKREQSKPSGGK